MINNLVFFLKLLKRTREFWSVGPCILNRSHSQSMIGLTGDKVLITFLLLGQDLWSHIAKSHGPSKILIKSCGILKEIKLHRNSIISLMVITITFIIMAVIIVTFILPGNSNPQIQLDSCNFCHNTNFHLVLYLLPV